MYYLAPIPRPGAMAAVAEETGVAAAATAAVESTASRRQQHLKWKKCPGAVPSVSSLTLPTITADDGVFMDPRFAMSPNLPGSAAGLFATSAGGGIGMHPAAMFAAAAAAYGFGGCNPGAAMLERLGQHQQQQQSILRSHVSTVQSKPIPHNDGIDLEAFKRKNPREWNMDDVIGWMISVSKTKGIPVEDMNMHRFANCTGPLLTVMSEQNFVERDGTYGSVLYHEFRKLFPRDQPGNYADHWADRGHKDDPVAGPSSSSSTSSSCPLTTSGAMSNNLLSSLAAASEAAAVAYTLYNQITSANAAAAAAAASGVNPPHPMAPGQTRGAAAAAEADDPADRQSSFHHHHQRESVIKAAGTTTAAGSASTFVNGLPSPSAVAEACMNLRNLKDARSTMGIELASAGLSAASSSLSSSLSGAATSEILIRDGGKQHQIRNGSSPGLLTVDQQQRTSTSSSANNRAVQDAISLSATTIPKFVGGKIKKTKLNVVCPVTLSGKPRKRSQHTRGNKLWEFILSALKDARTCPSVVKWEDESEGVFRIVESEKLARLWGDKKNNKKMTYEKLSRAMRTYYEKHILVPVPKTGLYPKKLVYKFGPNARGWQQQHQQQQQQMDLSSSTVAAASSKFLYNDLNAAAAAPVEIGRSAASAAAMASAAAVAADLVAMNVAVPPSVSGLLSLADAASRQLLNDDCCQQPASASSTARNEERASESDGIRLAIEQRMVTEEDEEADEDEDENEHRMEMDDGDDEDSERDTPPPLLV